MTAESVRDDSPDLTLALRCRGVNKRYPGIHALSNFDFEAAAGKVHALLGENGAGKSTFIKGLGGTLRFDSGTIELFGKCVEIGSPAAARRLGIEVAYQELSAIPDLTVARTIWLRRGGTAPLKLMSQTSLRHRTLELYDRLQSPRIDPDIPVRRLSVAERQVVEVIGSLATDPRVVVLDEPTAALPTEEAAWVLGLGAPPRRPGKARALHIAPPEGGRADRRPGYRDARWPGRRVRSDCRR